MTDDVGIDTDGTFLPVLERHSREMNEGTEGRVRQGVTCSEVPGVT